MSKLLPINSCSDCIYRDKKTKLCLHSENKQYKTAYTIPEWCPLSDYELLDSALQIKQQLKEYKESLDYSHKQEDYLREEIRDKAFQISKLEEQVYILEDKLQKVKVASANKLQQITKENKDIIKESNKIKEENKSLNEIRDLYLSKYWELEDKYKKLENKRRK